MTTSRTSLDRRVTVTLATCGQNSLFFGRLGDWTWETVAALAGTDVLKARNSDGEPTYLAFCYFRVRGSGRLHPHGLALGDDLDVTSRAFACGSESVLTMHRLRRAHDGAPAGELDPVEFHEQPRPDHLYVENFNRWVTRCRPGSNQDLVSSAPRDFDHHRLTPLSDAYSPRAALRRARAQQSFHGPDIPGYVMAVPHFAATCQVDITRDINGVGLVYFASYFSFIDTALLQLWRSLKHSDHRFLQRRLLDHRLAYYGNAEINSVLDLTLRSWQRAGDPRDEIVEVVIHERPTRRLLAVASMHLLSEEE